MTKQTLQRKGVLAVAIVLMIMLAIVGMTVTATNERNVAYADTSLSGSGTASDPYLIGTKAELEEFRDIIIGANGQTRNMQACARLTADINLENEEWTPIGTWSIKYQGTFDGAGHTVSGVYFNKPSSGGYYVGFFGAAQNATIKNLTIRGSITGCREVGGILGYAYGNTTIYKCTNECTVYSAFVGTASDGNEVGGIVGSAYNDGNVISACVNKGNVSTAVRTSLYSDGFAHDKSYVGGILGYTTRSVVIKNCVNEGNVSGASNVAGIAAYITGVNSVITGCFNKGTITSNPMWANTTPPQSECGGIAGMANADITYCGNEGNVTGNGYDVAGIVGGISGESSEVTYCYNTGNISGTYSVTGIAGSSYRVPVTNCYNTGDITIPASSSDRSSFGGIVTSVYQSTVSYVFNTGRIIENGTYKYNSRGSIASSTGSGAAIHHAYYLNTSYNKGIGWGYGESGPAAGCSSTVLTAAQMATQSSFAGFDFNNVWIMDEDVGHPVLRHSHDFGVLADEDTDTITAACERPYGDAKTHCDNLGVSYTLTLHAPTMARERDGGIAAATFDADELAAFNAGTGLGVSNNNVTYARREGSTVTELGTTAPTTYGDYTVKLTVGDGSVTYDYTIAKLEVVFDKDVLLNGSTSETTVSNLNGSTAASLLDDEEIERYLSDEVNVSIYLEVTTESSQLNIPSEDKSVAKALVDEAGVKQGAYLDLTLFKKVVDKNEDPDQVNPTKISESATAFDVTVDIPADLAEPFGCTRTYSIVRVHNGEAETLPSTVNNGKISFSTDKFSTYMIAYSDNYDENGEYIEFTVDVVGDAVKFVDNNSVGDTVTITYKITHNDGFNSILLIPQYDASVFDIASISVNETALGAATITNGDGVKKILLENTGAKYEALDGENEFFLTITYTILEATAGDYEFSLVLSSQGDNTASVAYYIVDGANKGDQNQVAIKVIQENALTLVTKETPVITIGYTNETNEKYGYSFEYAKAQIGIERTGEFTDAYLTDHMLVPSDNEWRYDTVYFTFTDANGNSVASADTPAITYTWYYWAENDWAEMKDNQNQPVAPSLPGNYKVVIASAEDGRYYAATAEREFDIHARTIYIDMNDQTSAYGEEIVELIYADVNNSNVVCTGDYVAVIISTTATSSSDAGTYPINGAIDYDNFVGYTVYDEFRDTNTVVYEIIFRGVNSIDPENPTQPSAATYTITPIDVTLTALDQQAPYTGSEPTVDQTEYEITGYSGNAQVTITKASGVNAGTYTLTPAIALDATNYNVSVTNGTFTITAQAVVLTALDQQAPYTGSEPTVDQTEYEITGYSGNAEVTITKESGVDAGTYTLTPAIALDANNYSITINTGIFTITTQGVDQEYIESFFAGLTETYNSAVQDLLSVDANMPAWIAYSAPDKDQTDADTYTIHVTVTLNEQDAENYTNGQSIFVFTVTGKIDPAAVTITADDKTSEYGATPAELTYDVEGTIYNNEVEISISTTPEITTETTVGEYPITVSASNGNYDITLVGGTYNVVKATSNNISIVVSADDIYYNRELSNSIAVTVNGNVTLDSTAYTVTYYKNNEAVTPVDAGEYTLSVTVNGTDNYVAKTETTDFEIKKVKLEGVTFTYSHGNVTWTVVENDIGKTSTETGVAAMALKEGVTITYKVYDGETLIGTYNEREFDAAAATTYKVVAIASDDNYIASESTMIPAYSVSFDGNAENVTGIPATLYIFNGQTVGADPSDPELAGKSFMFWSTDSEASATATNKAYSFANAEVTENVVVYAIWSTDTYKITLLYLPDSSTQNVDKYVFYLTYEDTFSYDPTVVKPEKASVGTNGAGITYAFANKWVNAANENEVISVNENGDFLGFTMPEANLTFVAVFDATVHSFTITYYFSDNGSTTEYVQIGDAQSVEYGAEIEYSTYEGATYSWFKADYWYANEGRTESVVTTMPDENISVYGTYKFDIGAGDVNASGTVTADDITLYRKWIVGGYSMTVVEIGNEWATVSDSGFDPTGVYFIKRVADINVDESKDIRDVSITRMALVGGYTWDIVTGETVTGGEIVRSQTVNTYEALAAWFENGHDRISLSDDVTSASSDFAIVTNKNIYIDLCGNTLTVRSINFSTSGNGATITVKNGTIVTTSGITITAPNGNVIIRNVAAYDNGNEINLQAASNSLHFFGNVSFRNGTVLSSTAADVKVAEGTHIVIEEAAQLVVQKIVAAVVTNNTFVADETAEISVTNESATTEPIVIVGQCVEDNSTVGNKIVTKVSSLEELIAANGKSVYLGADIETGNVYIAYSQNTTINLNGHSVTFGKWGFEINSGATLVIGGEGSVTALKACFDIVDASTLYISGGVYESTGDCAIYCRQGSSLTIDDATITAQEACVVAYENSQVLIEDGEYTSVDNFVIGTNGTAGVGGNVITINGGVFNGGIQTNGYIACGVYVANNDTVTVSGGTFNITNGIGILARSGNTTIGEDVVFNIEGNSLSGGVGDKSLNITSGSEIVKDLTNPAYPGGAPTVTNGSNYEVVTLQ